jgi:Domain of unknown function (DUF4184)
MPFTFSHPAIILPFISIKRKWRSTTGLVIGSITPDFEYFIRMEGKSFYSHTISGMFWFDYPLAIILCFLYHQVVRNPLIDNLPPFLNKRLVLYKEFQWRDYFLRNLLMVSISVLIGIASHLLWDSFTHDDGFFVEKLPVFTEYVEFGEMGVPVYKIFKILCSVIGGVIILVTIFKLKKVPKVRNLSNPGYWMVVSGISFSILVLRVYTGFRFYQQFNLVMTLISACLISLIFASMIFKKPNYE